ncbi:cAMP-binding protein [Fulvivirga imtechensis AK7]|uniref:cAMP-binding protein n=1 Tax=Fulvivirga imtechensis AK7 TaxID=1237149 RepID=L8JVX2_9BACT|nr:Crp/Fnr family transcriptional regulator [Fulvivirga imtechensis]ELR72955.1 cAMP-binding protein [Fulvivirga imtechensis AK7]
MDIYQALRENVFKLVAFEEEEWKDFISYWRPVHIKKREYIIKEGQTEKYFYFVYRGVLRGYTTKDGDEISIGFTYDGDYSGAYDSFLAQQPSDFSMQAITDCELLRISYTDLMAMFDKYKSAERWGRIFNANILIGMARRQLEVRSFSAEERFERLATQSPHILQLVPQKYLASYLGMTPETFSRLRKKR